MWRGGGEKGGREGGRRESGGRGRREGASRPKRWCLTFFKSKLLKYVALPPQGERKNEGTSPEEEGRRHRLCLSTSSKVVLSRFQKKTFEPSSSIQHHQQRKWWKHYHADGGWRRQPHPQGPAFPPPFVWCCLTLLFRWKGAAEAPKEEGRQHSPQGEGGSKTTQKKEVTAAPPTHFRKSKKSKLLQNSNSVFSWSLAENWSCKQEKFQDSSFETVRDRGPIKIQRERQKQFKFQWKFQIKFKNNIIPKTTHTHTHLNI